MRKVQGDRRLQVFKLLAESVGEPCKSAHAHSHREVLPLDMAGRNMGLVRASRDHCARRACHARRGITARPDRFGIVKFNNLPVVNVRAESPLDCVNVSRQGVGRKLDAIAQPLRKVGHEGHRSLAAALADAIGRDQLGIRVNRYKRPLVADLGAIRKAGNMALLHPAERPDFVALNAAAIEIAHLVIGKSGAAVPDLDHKPHDRIAVRIGHPLR